MLYKGKSELEQASPERGASILLMLFYTVITACVFVFFLFALDYALDKF